MTPSRPFLLLLCVAALSACSLYPEQTDSGSPDWSRGLHVGDATLDNPPAVFADAQGSTHLIWIDGAGEQQHLSYARLDAQANVTAMHALALDTRGAEFPVLVPAGPGALHLLFRASPPDGPPTLDRALYYARLSDAGDVLAAPMRLSAAGAVLAVQTVAQADGSVEVYWSLRDAAALAHARISPAGAVQPLASVPAPSPQFALAADAAQRLHAAWIVPGPDQDAAVYYGSLAAPQRVANFPLLKGTVVSGPFVAFDAAFTYLFWVHDQRRGSQTTHGTSDLGTAAVMYVAFPSDAPRESAPQLLAVPAGQEPHYAAHSGGPYHVLAPGGGPPSDYLLDFNLLPGASGEVTVFFTAGLQLKQRGLTQVASAVFAQGQLAGYQVVNRTTSASYTPVAARRADGQLDVVWFERVAEDHDELRYASTAPQIVARQQQVSAHDLFLRGTAAGFGELSALSYAPLALIWLMLPLLLLVGGVIFAPDLTLHDRPGRVLFGLALAAHGLAKFATLPPAADAIPGAALLLGLLLPALAAVAPLLLFWRRSLSPSPFASYFVFLLVDAPMTLLLYFPAVAHL